MYLCQVNQHQVCIFLTHLLVCMDHSLQSYLSRDMCVPWRCSVIDSFSFFNLSNFLMPLDDFVTCVLCVDVLFLLFSGNSIQVLRFFNCQIKDFLRFVNQIYTSLPDHLNKIFEPRSQIKVKDIAEINVDALLQETYTLTTIMTDKKNADNQTVSVSISV